MIKIFTYQLPFSKPFVSGSGVFQQREGVLIRYWDESIEVVTEASPLPGFSSDTLEEIVFAIREHQESLDLFLSRHYSIEELKLYLKKLPNLSSLQFALSFLGIQILSKRNSESLFDLFDVKKPAKVKLNDVLPIREVDDTIHHFKESYQKGFKTFKIKTGYPVDNLINTLKTLDQIAGQDCKFRVDANQSWPADRSLEIIEQLMEFNIEYIEEPFQSTNLQSLIQFSRTSAIPIALDESIQSIIHLEQLLQKLPNTIFVIKPMLLGNLFDLFETIAQFRTHFNRIVITTALESSIGRKSVASVASLIGDQTIAHGLNTGRFFETDLSNDFLISDGRLKLPQSGFYSTKIADLNNSYYQTVD